MTEDSSNATESTEFASSAPSVTSYPKITEFIDEPGIVHYFPQSHALPDPAKRDS